MHTYTPLHLKAADHWLLQYVNTHQTNHFKHGPITIGLTREMVRGFAERIHDELIARLSSETGRLSGANFYQIQAWYLDQLRTAEPSDNKASFFETMNQVIKGSLDVTTMEA